MSFRNADQLIQRFRGMLIANYGDVDLATFEDIEEELVNLWECEIGFDPEASPFAGETAFCVPGERS